MRLYHKDNGYHHLAVTQSLEDLLANGWVLAPKGFHKTLVNDTPQPARRGRKPKAQP